jgi:hypothetical protein
MKTNKVIDENPPIYYVVVQDDESGHVVKGVPGLTLPGPVDGYHLSMPDALIELGKCMQI